MHIKFCPANICSHEIYQTPPTVQLQPWLASVLETYKIISFYLQSVYILGVLKRKELIKPKSSFFIKTSDSRCIFCCLKKNKTLLLLF